MENVEKIIFFYPELKYKITFKISSKKWKFSRENPKSFKTGSNN
jgi:hypothetical protein